MVQQGPFSITPSYNTLIENVVFYWTKEGRTLFKEKKCTYIWGCKIKILNHIACSLSNHNYDILLVSCLHLSSVENNKIKSIGLP